MRKREEKTEKVKKNKKESELVTKESLCAVCALFSLLALLILCTRSLIFGEIGNAVHAFLTGVFGYLAYPLTLGALYLSVTALFEKRLVKNRKAGLCIALTAISAALIVHTAATYSWPIEGYISKCFYAGENFPSATATGWLGGLIVFAVSSVTSKVGAIVFFSVLTVFFGYLTFVIFKKRSSEKTPKASSAQETQTIQTAPVEIPLSQPSAPVYQQGQAPQPLYQQPVQPPQPSYPAYDATVFEQRPGVSLSDERQTPVSEQKQGVNGNYSGGSFSPFGTSQTLRESPENAQTDYRDSRAFLFGSSPAENFQRNLIFDPNSRVNKLPPVEPERSAPTGNGYMPSYSEAYQNSVNESSVERPVKIVADRSEERRAERDPYTLSTGDSVAPMRPIAEPTVAPQTPISYPMVEESRTPSEPPYVPPMVTPSEPQYTVEPERPTREETTEYKRHEYMDLFSTSNPNIFGGEERSSYLDVPEELPSRESDRNDWEEEPRSRDEGLRIFDEPELDEPTDRGRGGEEFDRIVDDERDFEMESPRDRNADPFGTEFGSDRSRGIGFDTEDRGVAETRPVVSEPAPTPPPPPPKPRVIKPYVRVPLDDFDCRDVEPTSNLAEVEETKANIIATLDDFKVTGASIASVTFGPTVTRYNVTIPRNISPRKVVALDQSIAISLHSSGVNIYPNYEDGVVSIEVPNKDRQFVQLGCMLTGDTFVNAKSSSLMFTMGKDVGNRKVYGDISKMIHLLVAGSSGSGKSVFLGSLIVSMIYKYSPEELRLILIDPKKTEFVLYNDLPHLMINEIITDVNKAVQSLNWAIGEMNRRYGLFEQMSRAGTYVVNLDQYNAHLEKSERLPKIVIIIDELADLMLAAKKDIEDRIQNLTQKARAAGIHLIVATQRPSTDVITGVIKSNLPTRIAFAVATDVDSRVILDQSGAQKLLGKGDFLYTMQGINTPVRVQSAFISAEDSQRVVNFIKANNEAYYDENATAFINNTRGAATGDPLGGGDEVEGVYIEALRYVILSGSASISMIQRKCSVGYNKAGKIVEWMEDMGYISSFDGAKARKVLITKEEFESKYGSL